MNNNIQLTPELISRLDNLSLKARMVVEGFIVGLHKSPFHGFSVEFSEHRAYGYGDEIKHIDWKLFGKTDRFYIKQFIVVCLNFTLYPKNCKIFFTNKKIIRNLKSILNDYLDF